MNALKKAALLCALFLVAFSAHAQTVSGTKVVDDQGNLLVSGNWCFGSTCLTVTDGAFSGTVSPGTSTVTVTDGGVNTYLTVPNVVIGGGGMNWDLYVVPMTFAISGMGTPRIACQPGATFNQTDAPVDVASWTCTAAPAGQAVWVNAKAAPALPPGMYAGVGNPNFNCTVPCTWVQTDNHAAWTLTGNFGETGTTWVNSPAAAGGTNLQLQFNDLGALGGTSGLSTDATHQNLNVAGAFQALSSQKEFNGLLFSSPEAAVAAACSSSKAVYFPAGMYPVTTGLQGCTGLRIRCAASDVFGSNGTVFQLASGAAIWGFSNPNADASSGTPNSNVNASMFMDNCKFDVSQDSAALGAIRVKGVRFSTFVHVGVMTNNNTNPAITFDGSNYSFNDGDYDNTFFSLNLLDTATNSNGVGELFINASNDNHFFGGIINRFGTDVHISNGNNNTWNGVDGEGWQQNCLVLDNSNLVNANDFKRFRCETGWLSWVANQSVALGKQIIDSNGNRETVTTAGTNGASVPTWATTFNGTTTSGTAVYTLDRLLPTDVIATGSSNNTINQDLRQASMTALGLIPMRVPWAMALRRSQVTHFSL